MIDAIINSFNVKYSILDKEVSEKLKEGNRANIYISMESILSYFFTPSIIEYSNSGKIDRIYEWLAPLLINIGAHYRHYFYSRWNVSTNIIFYDTDFNSTNNITYCPEYNNTNLNTIHKQENANIMQFINHNLKSFKEISNYIKDFSYIKLNKTEGGLIPYHIISENSNSDLIHIVITRNLLDFQLINMKNTFILLVNKDKSVIVNKENIYEELLKKDKVIYRPSINISSEFITLLLPIVGVKSRSISGFKGCRLANTLRKVEKKIKDGMLVNGKMVDFRLFNDILGLNDDAYKLCNNIYRAISYSFQYKMLDEYQKKTINDMMNIYIPNNQDLMYLNEHVYKTNEMKLSYLKEGVK
jgi:hypothetical protein|nr:MAG TPA: hypothetical protein [Caudoviricetes sp.]